jgi:integrase
MTEEILIEPKRRRKKARNGAGSFHQLQDGRWRLRFTLQDGRQKDVYGITQAECRNKRRDLEQQAAGGRDVTKRDPTVADFMSDWLTWADNGKRAPSTLSGYRGLIEHHIKPTIGHIRLSKLSTRDVDRLLRQMQTSGLSARTAQQCRTVLNMALKQALRWDMVSRNVAGLTESPTVSRKEFKPLTVEQIRILLDETKGERYGPLYAVAIGTGMRQGELLGLRWQDVDREKRTIEVKQSLKLSKDGGREMGVPKTPKSRRRIYLPSFVIDALEDERREQKNVKNHLKDRWHETGLVFTNGIGRPLDGPTVTRSLSATLQKLGLPHERAFHGLRHAAATLMAANGVAANVARDVLGHTDIKMTLNVYTHADDAALTRAADAIENALNPPRNRAKTG